MPFSPHAPLLILLSLMLAVFAPPATSLHAADDPVARFIADADSLARAKEARAFEQFVGEHTLLCGAAVGQLLDDAVKAGDGGDRAAEASKFALAGRIASIHRDAGGSSEPLDLVKAYRGWTSAQRAIRSKAKGLEDAATQARKAGDLEGAVRLLEEAKGLYAKIGDRRSTAIVWGSLGVAHWYRNDWEAVGASYKNALEARRAIDDRILEGKTLNGLGTLNFQTGNYAAAIDYYTQAQTLRRSTGDLAGLGTSLTYMGNAYVRLGRLAEARDKFDEAFAILEKDGTPQQTVEALNSSANALFEMGRLREACDVYAKAIEISSAAGERSVELSSRLNLADALRSMGRYRESLAELERVRGVLVLAPDPQKDAELSRNRGIVNSEIGELDRARDDFLAYLTKSRLLGDRTFEIEAFVLLGSLYRDLGAFSEGLACADSARAMAEAADSPRQLLAAIRLTGDVEHDMRRDTLALEHYRTVLERSKAGGLELDALDVELRIANALAALGRREEARELFGAASKKGAAMGIGLAWVCQFGIADTYERESPDSAYSRYEKAFELLERSRAEIGASEVQTGFLSGDLRRLFEEVAVYYASLEDAPNAGLWSGRAFQTIERGKARGLLDLLEQAIGSQSSPDEEAVLDSLYRLDASAPGSAERARALKSRYAFLRERRVGGALGALATGGGVAGLEDIERSLPKGTVALEYALGDTVSLLWAVDRSGSSLYRLPGRSVLGDEIERLRDAISRPGPGDAALLATARSLYVTLIAPAERRISKAKRLVIIPDGALFEVPFEALLTRDPKAGAPWKDRPFLAKSFATTYAPSASVLLRLEGAGRAGSTALELVAMGDPDFSRLAASGDAALRPLPFSRAEVEVIAACARPGSAALFLGADASEGALKRVLRERPPRILHLATHGIIDPAEPVKSSIVLSPSEAPKEDGHLYTLEILSLPAAPELVVLSACESAGGMISRGEGVVGLSRAFLAVGARGVVASLWPVSDASTAELMKTFYGAMLRSHEPAFEALRQARLSLLDSSQFAHPFYWSPFILIGTQKTPW